MADVSMCSVCAFKKNLGTGNPPCSKCHRGSKYKAGSKKQIAAERARNKEVEARVEARKQFNNEEAEVRAATALMHQGGPCSRD